MSYNLAFWAGGDELDPGDVYPRLNDEQHVIGVDEIDRDRVVRAFAEDLPGWSWDGQFLHPPDTGPDEAPAFDVSIGKQMVEIVGYGWEEEHLNAIISAIRPLGYRLFDPQIGKRFA